MQGTPHEYKAIVQGSNALFGTYNVNEADTSIVFRIELSTYPNWNGDEQKRMFTRAADALSYVDPTTTVGGGPSPRGLEVSQVTAEDRGATRMVPRSFPIKASPHGRPHLRYVQERISPRTALRFSTS